MIKEEMLLAESISDTIEEARKARSTFHNELERNSTDSADDDLDLRSATIHLAYLIEKILRDTAILAERLGLPLIAKEINAKRLSTECFTEHKYDEFDILPHLPVLSAAEAYFYSIRTITDSSVVTVSKVVQSILESTPNILFDAGIVPDRESLVRNEVLRILKYSFRDSVKEVGIAKTFKNYSADIGIPSLGTLIEIKFVKTEAEMKSCLDGIYADMKGYHHDYEWRTCYAVFYMAGPFFTQSDVEREFRKVRADAKWIPIVINGQTSPKKALTVPAEKS